MSGIELKRKLTKPQLRILERVFTAEIEGRLPFQFPGRVPALVAGLVEDQFLAEVEKTSGYPPMKISGYVLTPRGHLYYCQSCKDVPEEA